MTVKEMLEMLQDLPEDESVLVPDFNGYDDKEVRNLVLTAKGVLIDY